MQVRILIAIFGLIVTSLGLFGCTHEVGVSPENSTRTGVDGPEAGEGRVDWYQVEMLGKASGYFQTSETPRPDGGYTLKNVLKLSISRGDVPLQLEALEIVEEDASGKILSFVYEQKPSKNTTTVRGLVRGQRLAITTEISGSKPRSSEVAYDETTLGRRRVQELCRERLKDTGDTLNVRIFLPDFQRSSNQKVVLGPIETVNLPSGARKLRKVYFKIDLLPTGPITHWVDAEFRPIKMLIPTGQDHITIYHSSRNEVLKADYSSPPEIYFASSIPVTKPVPRNATRATYRLSYSGEGPLAAPRGANLEIIDHDADEKVWTIGVRRITTATVKVRPSEVKESEEIEAAYLQPSSYLQSDDQKIVRQTERALKGLTDDRERADRLERWVHDFVTEKNLHTAFATASEVLERREGDCSEHAVLLAAMARAAGIPSRVAAGLLYYRGAFVGHMWTELYCDGTWIPLDSTQGKGSVGPDHIPLTVSDLGDTTTAQFFMSLLPVLGNLRIEVLEVVSPQG